MHGEHVPVTAEAVAEVVRAEAQARGWSLCELCRRAGISTATVIQWGSGGRHASPSAPSLVCLSASSQSVSFPDAPHASETTLSPAALKSASDPTCVMLFGHDTIRARAV